MPSLVTCPCQNCNGHIQFDPATLSAENNTIACPHCGMETILFVPPPTDAKMQTILSPAPPSPLISPLTNCPASDSEIRPTAASCPRGRRPVRSINWVIAGKIAFLVGLVAVGFWFIHVGAIKWHDAILEGIIDNYNFGRTKLAAHIAKQEAENKADEAKAESLLKEAHDAEMEAEKIRADLAPTGELGRKQANINAEIAQAEIALKNSIISDPKYVALFRRLEGVEVSAKTSDAMIEDFMQRERAFAQMQTNLVLTNWTFTNLQGRIFSNTTFESATFTNISVTWQPYGYARIDFTNLPEDIQKQFHYDREKAETFIAEQDARNEEISAERARSAIDVRIRREFDDEKARIEATQWAYGYGGIGARVFQIVKDGVLIYHTSNTGRTSEEVFMVWHYPSSGLVDEQALHLKLYSFGTYQYKTVMGSSKTIPQFTTNIMLVIQKDFYDKHPGWPNVKGIDKMTPEQIQELQREQKLEAQLRGIDYPPISENAP
jgi:hypothetical protein